MSSLFDFFSIRNVAAVLCAVGVEAALSIMAGSQPFQEEGWLYSFSALLAIFLLLFWGASLIYSLVFKSEPKKETQDEAKTSPRPDLTDRIETIDRGDGL